MARIGKTGNRTKARRYARMAHTAAKRGACSVAVGLLVEAAAHTGAAALEPRGEGTLHKTLHTTERFVRRTCLAKKS